MSEFKINAGFSMKAKISGEVQLSAEFIVRVLDYVLPSERCILRAVTQDKKIDALVRFRSPQYTKNPVEYLSSSVLAISLAQASHLLLEGLVERGEFPYQSQMTTDYLAHIRENHELYFLDMRIRFHKKYPPQDYPLSITLAHSRRVENLSFHKLIFNVKNFAEGYFLASVPLIT